MSDDYRPYYYLVASVTTYLLRNGNPNPVDLVRDGIQIIDGDRIPSGIDMRELMSQEEIDGFLAGFERALLSARRADTGNMAIKVRITSIQQLS